MILNVSFYGMLSFTPIKMIVRFFMGQNCTNDSIGPKALLSIIMC